MLNKKRYSFQFFQPNSGCTAYWRSWKYTVSSWHRMQIQQEQSCLAKRQRAHREVTTGSKLGEACLVLFFSVLCTDYSKARREMCDLQLLMGLHYALTCTIINLNEWGIRLNLVQYTGTNLLNLLMLLSKLWCKNQRLDLIGLNTLKLCAVGTARNQYKLNYLPLKLLHFDQLCFRKLLF